MKNPKSLLSAEEILYIESEGLPRGGQDELLKVGSDNSIVFTLKGTAVIGYAMQFFKYPGVIADLKTFADYLYFKVELQALVADSSRKNLEKIYLEGDCPPEDRAVVEAFLYGTPLESLDMLTRALDSSMAGPNVFTLPRNEHRQP